jgi:hypothetical protein
MIFINSHSDTYQFKNQNNEIFNPNDKVILNKKGFEMVNKFISNPIIY